MISLSALFRQYTRCPQNENRTKSTPTQTGDEQITTFFYVPTAAFVNPSIRLVQVNYCLPIERVEGLLLTTSEFLDTCLFICTRRDAALPQTVAC